jgi:hypothetical protein
MALSCFAQQGSFSAGGLKYADEEGSAYSKPTISGDGHLLAHLGRGSRGLFVKDLTTGEEEDLKIEQKLDCSDCVIGALAFSPDGKRLAFNARWFVESEGNIYSIGSDGSDLVQLAPGDASTRKPYYDMQITNLSYSPDGSSLLALVIDKLEQQSGGTQRSGAQYEYYVGLLAADHPRQDPKTLAIGRPLRWSSDGRAVYYFDGRGILSRITLQNGRTESFPEWDKKLHILGTVPGADAVFVVKDNRKDHGAQCGTNCSVTILNLNGTVADPTLVATAAGIPYRDAEGRYLRSIDGTNQHQLLLRYTEEFQKVGSETRVVRFP